MALLVLAAFMFAGTPLELLLADHTGEPAQFIPFLLCGIGFSAILTVLLRPARRTLLILRVAMFLNIGGGVLGMGLHLIGNYTFAQEIRPNAPAATLLLNTVKGANPMLAPGILVFFALIVLIATYRHPALRYPLQEESP